MFIASVRFMPLHSPILLPTAIVCFRHALFFLSSWHLLLRARSRPNDNYHRASGAYPPICWGHRRIGNKGAIFLRKLSCSPIPFVKDKAITNLLSVNQNGMFLQPAFDEM